MIDELCVKLAIDQVEVLDIQFIVCQGQLRSDVMRQFPWFDGFKTLYDNELKNQANFRTNHRLISYQMEAHQNHIFVVGGQGAYNNRNLHVALYEFALGFH